MTQSKSMQHFIDGIWDKSIIPSLIEYIKIPNKSPHFDSDWLTNGYMLKATKLIADWCKQQSLANMHVEIIQLENRTPVIFIDVPGNNEDTILLYGHLDKQPEMSGWDADLAPFKPVLRGDKLYGRGAADDGYAAFASVTAIKALQEAKIKHARCVILIEACEESGSYDLPFYISALKSKIGTPSLVICLDSGCGNYDQMWLTTSLRGLVSATLEISVLKEGIHSGSGSGVVPSCFRILRQLLDRIEDVKTGDIILSDLKTSVPTDRREQAKKAANVLGKKFYEEMPFLKNVEPESQDISELILRRTWYPALSVVGIDGLPAIANAGNVTIPKLTTKLSMRLSPTCSEEKAASAIKNILTQNPPANAHIKLEIQDTGPGWNAPSEAPWLKDAANEASLTYFGKETMYMGEGGSIPFMGMLGIQFPQAQFVITGVLGPNSNAHGPNEFLHIPTGKKLTACIAHVIEKHYVR